MKSKQEIQNQLKLYEANVKLNMDAAENADDPETYMCWLKKELAARGRVSALRWVLGYDDEQHYS